MRTRNLILTALISAAVTSGSLYKVHCKEVRRSELLTPDVVELINVGQDVFNPLYARENPESYKAKSERCAELMSDEKNRRSIEELLKLKNYEPFVVIGGLAFYGTLLSLTVRGIGSKAV